MPKFITDLIFHHEFYSEQESYANQVK